MRRPVYMEVTKDRYELPLAVADSQDELARMRSVQRGSVIRALKRKNGRSKYRVVWINDGRRRRLWGVN